MSTLYIGRFDPITKAHLHIALKALDLFDNEVIFVPVSDGYHNLPVLPFDMRYRLIEYTINGIDKLEVSDIEDRIYQKTHKQPKTFETIEEMPCDHLLIGSDNFIHMHKWYKAEDIINKVKLIVYMRTNNTEEIKRSPFYNKAFFIIDDIIDIKASDIRNDLTGHKYDLDVKTYRYITSNPDIKKYFK